MGKRIVLLSDGTGNAAAAVWRTNVWRIFESLDLTAPDQVALYADGVGTSAFKPLALLGGVFGWGLKRNVLDLYKFACRNHQSADDELYAFGFSRGAFTVRVVLGLINNQGLVTFADEDELARKAVHAYRAYRRERYHSWHGLEAVPRYLRDLGSRYDKSQNRQVGSIRFIGVWDTVAAYGLPIEELTRGFSQWIWPLELPNRTLSPKVHKACHALALDDERTTFHPVMWNEREETPPQPAPDGYRYTKDERISQVWFSGAHSNVGGGYPDDALAHIPLCWIMEEARHCGLRFKCPPNTIPDSLLRARSGRDKDGRQYDPRRGLGGYYRYGPRKLADLCHMRFSKAPDDEVEIAAPKIHETALQRIHAGAHIYAPIGLPSSYEVVEDSGRILTARHNPYESIAQAAARADHQEKAWNLVWLRRLVYFVTVGVSVYLLTYPLEAVPRSAEFETRLRPLSDLIRLVGGFVPGSFSGHWINSYASDPGWFFSVVFIIGLLASAGLMIESKISRGMHAIWKQQMGRAFVGNFPHAPVQWLRTQTWYKTAHWAIKRHIAPAAFILCLVWLAVALTSHLAFNFLDSGGIICKGTGGKPMARHEKVTLPLPFDTSALCFATGVELEQFGRYRLTIKPIPLPLGDDAVDSQSPWRDSDIRTSPRGFYTADLGLAQQVVMGLGVPLRRALFRPWFRVIARVGRTGSDEEFLDPDADKKITTLQEVIRARQTGELFIYVNDAVLPLPGLYDHFYRRNAGTAEVTIERL